MGPLVAMHLKIIWIFMVSVSFVEYVLSFLLATIHLMYTEALTSQDAKDYYEHNKNAPAAPMIWLFCGMIWHLLATLIFYFFSYYFGWVFIIPVIHGTAI